MGALSLSGLGRIGTLFSLLSHNTRRYINAHRGTKILILSPNTASKGDAASPRLHTLVVLTWIAALLTPLMHLLL